MRPLLLAGLLPLNVPVVLEVPVALDRDEARRRAIEELSKAKYGGTPAWVSDLAEWIGRRLVDLLELYLRYARGPGSGSGVSLGFVIVVLVLLALIALVVWKVGLPRWRRTRRDATVEMDPTAAPDDYRRLAKEHAAAGDWRAAVRDQFRGLVRDLEVRTVLDVRPARTAFEAAGSAARTLPDARDALMAGAELFSAVLYGDHPADPEAYARMVGVDDAVVTLADRADLAAGDDPEAPAESTTGAGARR